MAHAPPSERSSRSRAAGSRSVAPARRRSNRANSGPVQTTDAQPGFVPRSVKSRRRSARSSPSGAQPSRRSKTRRPRTKVSKRARRGDELDYRYERRASGGNKTRRQLDRELARRYEYVDSVIVDDVDEEAL